MRLPCTALLLAGLPLIATPASAAPPVGPGLRFEVTVPAALRAEPVTGRVFVFLAKDSTPEPRLAAGGMVSIPFFGADV
ncbi:MAG TPA: hypothetical protein VEI47_03645, partial [Gemmatimonadales bacterium]|nr:hypothetical protein [Gemmatimonadales bacterium]